MRSATVILAALVPLAWAPEPAMAQSSGCVLEPVGATQLHIVRCGTGITITAEPGADYTLNDRDGDGAVDRVRLNAKALLLEVSDDGTASGFEVVAPQAIAAVRGTRWAVDADGEKTSVFVVRGAVSVRRRSGSAEVVLGSGEGVDVGPGPDPLTVRRWPAARVDALLARFGL